MVVYLDILLAVNMLLNFILLLGAGWVGLRTASLKRYLLAASVGTFFWLIFFYMDQYIFIDWFCRIAGGLAMAWIAWKPKDFRSLFSGAAIILVTGQLLGGGIYSVVLATSGPNLTGSVQLITVAWASVVMLVIAAGWAGRVHKTKQLRSYMGEVEIWFQGRSVKGRALFDSGNTLRHPVTNWPVMVLERDLGQELFGDLSWFDSPYSTPPQDLEARIGLIPFKSVGGTGILAAVKPDLVRIYWGANIREISQVYVALRQKENRPLEHQVLAFPFNNWEEGEIIEKLG